MITVGSNNTLAEKDRKAEYDNPTFRTPGSLK
jgi:hypothetical protein